MKLDPVIHLRSWVELRNLVKKFGKKAIIKAVRRG